eukprot:scaffold1511_cov18-Tisochrysis_lutea.AAC.1
MQEPRLALAPLPPLNARIFAPCSPCACKLLLELHSLLLSAAPPACDELAVHTQLAAVGKVCPDYLKSSGAQHKGSMTGMHKFLLTFEDSTCMCPEDGPHSTRDLSSARDACRCAYQQKLFLPALSTCSFHLLLDDLQNDVQAAYEPHFQRYCQLYPALAPVFHAAHTSTQTSTSAPEQQQQQQQQPQERQCTDEKSKEASRGQSVLQGIVAPSILAADFSRLGEEVESVLCNNLRGWVHVDVFDGSAMCNGNLTIGPPVISSLRAAHPAAFLDVHLAVDVSGKAGIDSKDV